MGGIEEVEMFSVAPSNLERADSIPVGHGRVSDCLDIRAMSMSHVIINHVSLRQYQFHYFLCVFKDDFFACFLPFYWRDTVGWSW